MKKVTCIVVGYGDRGSVYSAFALSNPDEFEIVGVVDPDPYRANLAKETFKLKESQIYSDFDEFIELKPKADCVICATMDHLHYVQGKAIMEAGYHMLIENSIFLIYLSTCFIISSSQNLNTIHPLSLNVIVHSKSRSLLRLILSFQNFSLV